MKNGKVMAIISVLKKHGIEITSDIALEILSAQATRSQSEYEVGDFVLINDGMGEYSFGEVIKAPPGHYKVNIWDESTEQFTYIRDVYNDIRYITTKEEARNDYLVRSGQKK